MEVAGKTGSAETGMSRRRARGKWFSNQWNETHSWFMGYAPADHPEIAFCVLAEFAGHGSHTAAPISKKILEAWAEIRGRKPDGE